MQEAKLLTKGERDDFNALFPQLVRDLTEIPEYQDMPETNQWLATVLQYNVPHGKRHRGLATALAYRYLAKELTEESVKLSYILGWCVEILQANILVADDIMDESETRRGRPCWYKMEDVGVSSVNDAFLLESSLFILLRKYFRNKEYYTDILDIIHDVNHKTLYGQSLDTRIAKERDLESYTMEKFSAIAKYKTGFYSFYLPVRLAMAMAGINEPELVEDVLSVSFEMGYLYQLQNDYLDCFGDVEVSGKIGTDIQECKCTWLFIVAKEKAGAVEKKLLLENYGQSNPEKVEEVKQLYLDLQLPEMYSIWEQGTFDRISKHIEEMSEKLPKQLFYDICKFLYR